MNAKSKSPVLFPLSLILLVGFTVLEINLAYATPIVRLKPTVVQINSFSNFKRIDIPGTISGLEVTQINDSGQVAGKYNDANGYHIFLYNTQDETFITEDFLADKPSVIAINDSGQLLGNAYNTLPHIVMPYYFVYSDGTKIDIRGPDDSTSLLATYAKDINNLGQVAGIYYNGSQNRGYIYDISAAKYTSFDPPSHLASPERQLNLSGVTGINDGGQVIGTLKSSSDQFSGFIYNNGVFDVFKVGNQPTFPTSINNNGRVAGVYGRFVRDGLSASGLFVYEGDTLTVIKPRVKLAGRINSTEHRINDNGQMIGHTSHPSTGALQSYLYSNGIFAILSIPDATSTDVTDINNRGEVAGTYTDASGVHGFIATPIIATPVSGNLGGTQSPLNR